MLSFGFAKSFPSAVISRVIAGVLNGNAGVAKTIVSLSIRPNKSAEPHDAKIVELSTQSNRARSFSLLLISWVAGATISEYV
jgi:hypothetical protein